MERCENTNFSDNWLLSKIKTPADLRMLGIDELPRVCSELRAKIIDTLSRNPGHFASSMGSVELTVALHYVFSTPEDRIVWDVGHQAYSHKLLTGRADRFDTLRKEGGLSGFPNPAESEYDTFIAGHASNSISAALGMAVADLITPGHENRHTVAVIGDASISGGLAFEGLNNAAQSKNNLLIVLNDNDMSIDPNVGALHRYLSRLSTSAGYNRVRYRAYNFLKRHKVISEKGRGRLIRFTNSVKSLISHHQNIFEGLNIRYFGPIDGHDVKNLVKVLGEIKDMKGPRLLHICTQKGRGYKPAEENPAVWHAPGKFNPLTGERLKNDKSKHQKWQDVFGDALVELASLHPEIVGITAAMPSGTSISKMMKAFPDRVFDVGISEGHAVTFAGGLAAAGKHPFVAIYSSFLQRAYDNIIHDVAIQHLPVTFCIDRAGVVGDDGVTHHGLFDEAYLRVIPGMLISAPMDEQSLRNLMYTSLHVKSPMSIRYPRGETPASPPFTGFELLEVGKARSLATGSDGGIALLTLGAIGEVARKAADELSAQGISVAHYDMLWLAPLDKATLSEVCSRYKGIITVEDASVVGGLGSAVAEWLVDNAPGVKLKKLGVPGDTWVNHAGVERQHIICGYDKTSIMDEVRAMIKSIDAEASYEI